jgi:hypothetical protein
MKSIRSITVCLLLLALGVPLFATSNVGAAQQPSLAATFARLDQLLATIERGLAQIERTGAITTEFDIEAALDSYYREANSAFGVTMRLPARKPRESTDNPQGLQRPGNVSPDGNSA